ncbi:unnamed protein product [Microthlaspi erraticum]|uniref:Uncharacterized protein n=1 Tax=Microthlaspi erraticum TaxID=1685480 RepID=A0A6D2JEP8_9BRAS|nr:unnamed protein product [Microthlaspi erraticum]CAA7051180.1 unnamed protein product [Microthlaspi erraticum]
MASSPSDTKAKNCKFAASQVAKANNPQEDGYCPRLVRPADFKPSGLVTPNDFKPSGLVTPNDFLLSGMVTPADFLPSEEERGDVLKQVGDLMKLVEKMLDGGQETREELEKPKS